MRAEIGGHMSGLLLFFVIVAFFAAGGLAACVVCDIVDDRRG